MEIDVFVSYHTDSSLHIVEAIVRGLEAKGLKCWYANRNAAGDYAESIAQAIYSCRIFLLVLNQAASQSVHVINEIDMATKREANGEKIKIIPFHVTDESITPKAQYYLGRVHWIDAVKPPMYQRVQELCQYVFSLVDDEQAILESEKLVSAYRLISKIPQPREVFVGRQTELSTLHQLLCNNRVVFVEGIGGIGKSELVKQYMLQHREEYDYELFVTYTQSLKELMCNTTQIEIDGLPKQDANESADAFFSRKLEAFRTAAHSKVLLVVDNYDTEQDPDFEAFIQGEHKIIFTTRCAHPQSVTLKVGGIPDVNELFQIFERNYGSPISEEDRHDLLKLFQKIEYHTYAIELLAKQMETSFLTGKELLSLYEKGELSTAVNEQIPGRKGFNSAFGHIASVFSMSNLSAEEQQILCELSLVGIDGIPAPRLKEWANLSSFDVLNRLIHQSWIRRESNQRISLHPLMCDVVRNQLHPSADQCAGFLSRMTDYLFHAWLVPLHEKMAIRSCIISIADYFKPFDSKYLEIWIMIPNFLWQIGEFDLSIYYETIVYETCLAANGEASLATGCVAKALGGCYFNSGRLDESIPWYEQALRCIQLSNAPESEDLAMAYEKVARCYTWKSHQDFNKAKMYFQKCLDLRLQFIDDLQHNKAVSCFESRENYGPRRAQERLAETYMEIGRMHQSMGDHCKALEYFVLEENIFSTYRIENPSGRAYIDFDKGVSYYNLGMFSMKDAKKEDAAKQLNQALTAFQRALDSNLKMRGALAIDTIDNEEYLADTYLALGCVNDATNHYMAVYNMVNDLLGPDSARIKTIMDKLNNVRYITV